MKFRTLVIAGVLVGGFWFVTSRSGLDWKKLGRPMAQMGKLWSEPDVARTAGLSSDEVNNIDIYKLASPATVFITSTVYRRDFFFQPQATREIGSGFILNDDGRILTNFHVVSGTNQVEVALIDGSRYKAEILVRDRQNDLALIQIKPGKKLPVLKLGDSDRLQVGQKVLAIGNPFGFSGTLTTGIVSSLGRDIPTENNQTLEGMIQTDASINSGNSGGPLLDSQGSVVGINTAIYGPNGGSVGIGFAMPINRAKAMLEDYRSGKSFGRPRLGVSVVYITGEFAEALELPSTGGLLIQNVARGSSAEEAGLRGPRQMVVIGNAEIGVGGDLITALDGKTVDRTDAIVRALSKKRPGDPIEVTIYRAKKSQTIKVKLGEALE
ncbi:MAG: trypsin-like peptidase domain-containing protein [Bryobacteraceae bacterium]